MAFVNFFPEKIGGKLNRRSSHIKKVKEKFSNGSTARLLYVVEKRIRRIGNRRDHFKQIGNRDRGERRSLRG